MPNSDQGLPFSRSSLDIMDHRPRTISQRTTDNVLRQRSLEDESFISAVGKRSTGKRSIKCELTLQLEPFFARTIEPGFSQHVISRQLRRVSSNWQAYNRGFWRTSSRLERLFLTPLTSIVLQTASTCSSVKTPCTRMVQCVTLFKQYFTAGQSWCGIKNLRTPVIR